MSPGFKVIQCFECKSMSLSGTATYVSSCTVRVLSLATKYKWDTYMVQADVP